jgi:hypothetical protein
MTVEVMDNDVYVGEDDSLDSIEHQIKYKDSEKHKSQLLKFTKLNHG